MKQDILTIPSLSVFDDDIYLLYKFLKSRGFPKWRLNDGLDFWGVSLKDLFNLVEIKGDLQLAESGGIKSLGSLEYVGGSLTLQNSSVEDLGNLRIVSGHMNMVGSRVKSLNNLERVGQFLDAENSLFLEDLGNLEYVGWSLTLTNTKIKSLNNLCRVGKNLYLDGTPIASEMNSREIRRKWLIEIDGAIYTQPGY